jgi:hypothetical protein
VGTVFWSFRIMVGIGMLMIGVALTGAWLRLRGRLYDRRCLRLPDLDDPAALRCRAGRLVRYRSRAASPGWSTA